MLHLGRLLIKALADAAKSVGRAASSPEALPGPHAAYIPNVIVRTHKGHALRFYDDLIRQKTELINCMATRHEASCSQMKLLHFFVKWAFVLLAAGVCVAQQPVKSLCPMLPATPATPGHPHPQPRPQSSQVSVTQDNGVTVAHIITADGCFPERDPYQDPPGSNFLPTIWTNAFDGSGHEMPNTLPSTPDVPYNLHDGDPVVTRDLNPRSPTDDLQEIFDLVEFRANKANARPLSQLDSTEIGNNLQRGIDILEGNPVPDRLYSGLPLLHYKGPEKARVVSPILDQNGKVIGGNINIHQVWYDTHIESDVAFIDTTPVAEVPWTITYTIDVLSRGNDDFSPFVMYFDDPALSRTPLPHVAMDQTFFNMEEGTRTVFKIKMAPGKYYNLTHHWGWRAHPPRAQAVENATKRIPPSSNGKTLVDWEVAVFGINPSENKVQAIARIGDLAPEKRMWAAFRAGQQALAKSDYKSVAARVQEAREAFYDWRDRTRLPRGVSIDRSADLTLFYVNNTIYGEFRDGTIDFPQWTRRGTVLKVSLINGDYFEHGYQNVDFGGARGWENQFQSSVQSGGAGALFSFGRVHWWPNIPTLLGGTPFLVVIPPAVHTQGAQDMLGRYKVEITYQYEPSRRLRFDQFDPIHHDVAIFSVH